MNPETTPCQQLRQRLEPTWVGELAPIVLLCLTFLTLSSSQVTASSLDQVALTPQEPPVDTKSGQSRCLDSKYVPLPIIRKGQKLLTQYGIEDGFVINVDFLKSVVRYTLPNDCHRVLELKFKWRDGKSTPRI